MSTEDAEQLALDGLAPRKRRKRAPAVKTPAAEHPIAQVVLDIQAIHLGQTFDYYVEEKYSEAAQPGVMVRVRFGGQRVNGIIWKRTDTSETPESSLRFIERVVIDRVLVSESMRNDATLIADAFGGTRANILRLAVLRAWLASNRNNVSAIERVLKKTDVSNRLPRSSGNRTSSCSGNTVISTCFVRHWKGNVSKRSCSTHCRDPIIGGSAWLDGGRGLIAGQTGGTGVADHA